MTREEAIKTLRELCRETNESWYEETYNMAIEALAEPKTGEWIDWLGKGNEWECSVCKCSIESHGSIAYRYCPMCGADMRGE